MRTHPILRHAELVEPTKMLIRDATLKWFSPIETLDLFESFMKTWRDFCPDVEAWMLEHGATFDVDRFATSWDDAISRFAIYIDFETPESARDFKVKFIDGCDVIPLKRALVA